MTEQTFSKSVRNIKRNKQFAHLNIIIFFKQGKSFNRRFYCGISLTHCRNGLKKPLKKFESVFYV